MAFEVILPKQGWTADEATFMEWLKGDGEDVRTGEPLYSVETDKAVQEVEALDSGILRILPDGPREGDTIKIGEVIGYLVRPGEAVPGDTAVPTAGTADRVAPDNTRPTPVRPAVETPATVAPSPDASAMGGRPVTPRAARRAVAEGVDLRAVAGSGRGGRIREADVIDALRRAQSK